MTGSPTAVRGADVLVDSLYEAGVRTIFGVPGDTGVVFYDALHAATDRIRHVLARDERHAAKMADAFARVSNEVGVVEVSSGGGTTFVIGGLGEPYASGVPILVITSDIHSSSRDTGALTEIDQEALFSAVTKWQGRVTSAAEIPSLLQQGLTEAVSGRPGPVVLIIPEDILDELVEPQASPSSVKLTVPMERQAAPEDAVARAADLLREARRPLAVVGSGVHSSAAYDALARAAEHFGLSVATTIHGRGTIPDSSPWAIGTVGNNGERPGTNEFAADADVVLLVGTRGNATDTNSWTVPPRQGTTVIQIDIDRDRAGRNFPEALALVGDAGTVLEQLVETGEPADPQLVAERRAAVARLQEKWQGSLLPVGQERTTLSDLPEEQLLPSDLVRTVQDVLGGGGVVIADPGTPTPNVTVYWEVSGRRRSVIIPRGHGPMGYAIPALSLIHI